MKMHRSADLRLIIGALPHPVFLYAPDGTIAAVNPAAERMAGTSPAGRTVEEMIASLGVCHPDGTLVAVHDFPAVRALTGQVVIDCPLTITAADGIVFAIRASASPILCDGVVGVLSTWSDVTDLSRALDGQQRRRTEAEVQARRQEVMAETLAQQYEEIQAQEEKLRVQTEELAQLNADLTFQHDLLDTIFATVPQHVSVWDRDGRYVWMNEQAASGLKRPRDEMIGKTRQEIGLDLATMEPFMTEVRQVLVTGEPFTTVVLYPYPGGKRVVAVSSDITG